MSDPFSGFEKKRDYLICIDSDGCAIDSMDIKHFRCFGPCMVKEWGLEAYEKELLESWNEVNLYSMTRGINRFKGLVKALTEVQEKYQPVEFFYPILVKKEKESWANIGEAKDRLQAGTFAGEYQDALKEKFVKNLTK